MNDTTVPLAPCPCGCPQPDHYSKVVGYQERICTLTTKLIEAEQKLYLPGHWECPKCKFYCVSTLINVESGDFAANQEPQRCANGCGPMWRITHEQSANTMVDRCEELQIQLAQHQWYLVEEGQPKKSGMYVVVNRGEIGWLQWYRDKPGWENEHCFEEHPTHYRYSKLPE